MIQLVKHRMYKQTKNIFFRADGSQTIGLGHMFRTLALAEMVRSSFNCFLVTSCKDPFVIGQAKIIDLPIISVPEYSLQSDSKSYSEIPFDLEGIASKGDIIVLDGYHFGTNYRLRAKQLNFFVVFIDDLITLSDNADVVINHSPGAKISLYPTNNVNSPNFYLGLDYLLLRPSFFKRRGARVVKSKSVYIAFGGSDSYGFTAKFLTLCMKIDSQALFHIVLPPNNERLYSILEEMKSKNSHRVFLYKNLGADEVVNLIDKCTHAITSASTVSLEVVCRGIKPLIGYYVENQRSIYEGLLNEKLAIGLGNILMFENNDKLKPYLSGNNFHNKLFSGRSILQIFEEISV